MEVDKDWQIIFEACRKIYPGKPEQWARVIFEIIRLPYLKELTAALIRISESEDEKESPEPPANESAMDCLREMVSTVRCFHCGSTKDLNVIPNKNRDPFKGVIICDKCIGTMAEAKGYSKIKMGRTLA